jgi:hypothetical protein
MCIDCVRISCGHIFVLLMMDYILCMHTYHGHGCTQLTLYTFCSDLFFYHVHKIM